MTQRVVVLPFHKKDAPRCTVSCEHKSATFDGIKLSMTNLRNYIVIVPLCLLENGAGYHVCQALYLKNMQKYINAIIAEIYLSRKRCIVSIHRGLVVFWSIFKSLHAAIRVPATVNLLYGSVKFISSCF